MDFEVIKDNELTTEALLHSQKPLFTESEIRMLRFSPWTWHLISGEMPKKTNEFYMDAGYCSFLTTITMDHMLSHALEKKTLGNLSENDLRFARKTDKQNKLISIINSPLLSPIKGANLLDSFYQTKMAGYAIAGECIARINNDEKQQFIPKVSEKLDAYRALIPFAAASLADFCFVKGSYVDYVESGRKTKRPSDIDLGIMCSLDAQEYFEMMESYDSDANVDGIIVNPLFIPFGEHLGYTFFDLDINEKTKFVYADNSSEGFATRKNPLKLVHSDGNCSLRSLRKLTADKSELEELASSGLQRKIYSLIRKPEMFYKKLLLTSMQNEVEAPAGLSRMYAPELSIDKTRELAAMASIEISRMAEKISPKY